MRNGLAINPVYISYASFRSLRLSISSSIFSASRVCDASSSSRSRSIFSVMAIESSAT